ncbi:MAG: crossover junction endodeoxyribonuclease RuvC [Methanoculleaceae archaeon]
MIVLGIDPGIARVGYGILDDLAPRAFGVIETDKNEAHPERLVEIYRRVSAILDEHAPACVAVEKLYFSRNITSAMQVGEVRGVILLAAAERRIPVAEYTPNEVKLAVTGSGKADKRQVQEMVRRLLDLDEIPQPDDAADGLAVALCHANRR